MEKSNVKIYAPKELEIEKAIYVSEESIKKLDLIFLKWKEEIEEKYKEFTKDSRYKKELKAQVTLELKNGFLLKGDNAIDIFKRQEPNDVEMKSLKYEISTGYPSIIKLEIESSNEGRIRFSCSSIEDLDISLDDIFYDFKDWIFGVKPSSARKKFASISRASNWLIAIFVWLGLLVPKVFRQNPLKQQTEDLLQGGITENKVPKALEILLKNYLGETINVAPPWEKKFYFWYYISLAAWLIITWTVKDFSIELGKGKRNYSHQEFLAKTVPVFLLFSVLIPFLINKFSN